jgi:hypothetical protein
MKAFMDLRSAIGALHYDITLLVGPANPDSGSNQCREGSRVRVAEPVAAPDLDHRLRQNMQIGGLLGQRLPVACQVNVRPAASLP